MPQQPEEFLRGYEEGLRQAQETIARLRGELRLGDSAALDEIAKTLQLDCDWGMDTLKDIAALLRLAGRTTD